MTFYEGLAGAVDRMVERIGALVGVRMAVEGIYEHYPVLPNARDAVVSSCPTCKVPLLIVHNVRDKEGLAYGIRHCERCDQDVRVAERKETV